MSPDRDALEPWWTAIDDAVLGALTEARGQLTLQEIAVRVGISEDSARSVVGMLAEQGKIRIVAVEIAERPPLAVARRRAPAGPQSSEGTDRRRATP